MPPAFAKSCRPPCEGGTFGPKGATPEMSSPELEVDASLPDGEKSDGLFVFVTLSDVARVISDGVIKINPQRWGNGMGRLEQCSCR